MIDEGQKTILLVEDELVIAKAGIKTLKKYGYKVITAHSGKKAIETVETTPGIDLVLMDINLGSGIDGIEAAAKILETHDLPLIFLIAHTEHDVVEKAEGVSSYGYIVKNSSETILIASIKTAFRLFKAKMKKKAKEEALHQAEDNFRNFLDDSIMGVRIVSAAGETIYANQALLDIYGFASMDELKATSVVERYIPESLAEHQLRREQRKRGEIGPPEYEISIDRKDGEVRHLQVFRKEIIWDGARRFQVLYHDITDRKRADEALRASVEAFKGYFNMGTVGMSVTSLEKGWIEVNDCLCRMLGYAKEELLRLTWAEMTHPDDLTADVNLFNQVLAGQRDSYELDKRFIRKDGQIIHTSLYATCQRNPDGTVHHMLASFVNITERKRAEEKINALLQEKELLLKETHHRIKNNMAVINSLLTLQANAQDNETCKNILDDAARRVQSMVVLYDKLYRSESFHELSMKGFLTPLIEEIVGVFPTIQPVKTTVHIADFILSADILSPIGIIINELITNSMKYAFKDTQSGLITVSASKKDNTVTIIYEDNGIGLPESLSFENSSTFGLQLIHMLVKQIDGSITIERNMGTKYIIEFKV